MQRGRNREALEVVGDKGRSREAKAASPTARECLSRVRVGWRLPRCADSGRHSWAKLKQAGGAEAGLGVV